MERYKAYLILRPAIEKVHDIKKNVQYVHVMVFDIQLNVSQICFINSSDICEGLLSSLYHNYGNIVNLRVVHGRWV